ncbi:MAG TPA: calcium-translocating P-type ATPase, PMCA-type [Clostridiaceae bacterium]|jgi:Ca2+-transporting ATPase|nr:calcium-translocating P-type ATPase, PMCA-type [Clostridiaceae bacterium]
MNVSEKQQWHQISVVETEKLLATSMELGLDDNEVQSRLEKYGPNEMAKGKKKSILSMFAAQFKDFMIVVLIVAAIISFVVTRDVAESIIILLIVILNAVIGVVQEFNAEKSLAALQKLSSPTTKVLRNGQSMVLPSTELVPGDIVILETGDLIPADLRLIESFNLKVQEAALTGESVPVDKDATVVFNEAQDGKETPLGDRINMAYASCLVTYGRGTGIVTGTGMETEVGKIASMLMNVESRETPLQRKLNQLGRYLGIAALIICVVMFGIGVLNDKGLMEMFMVSVSLAVAAIPEGLPAISTIVLAMGVKKMVERNAIMRNLPSVETLGSTSIICSDKTGTLTQNKMTVVKLWANGKTMDAENTEELLSDDTFKQVILTSILCNDSKISNNGEGLNLIGDPTETALIDLGLKVGLDKRNLDNEYQRIYEVPFDSDRKLMSVVCKSDNGGLRVYTKGAVDVLLAKCNLSEEEKERIYQANEELASMALRVLALACKDIDVAPESDEGIEKNLVFIGLLGMIDPPRPEAKEAVKKCKTAGIKPIMITGDHKTTAVAIAKDLEILNEGEMAIEGSELNTISDEELQEKVENISVYSRVAPEHKVRIVNAWKEKGHIVAMTGDGVNDAPALKSADIGCAMGITGTEVAKEAADMVLTDDNFATIVAAVEEGRRIFDNILRAVYFLLSCNIGEIVALFTATIFLKAFGGEQPLIAIQILWVNLVTDSLPALALGIEPAEKGIMKRKPLPFNSPIFTKASFARLLYQGVSVGMLTLVAYQIAYRTTGLTQVGQTMSFAVLAFSQLFHVFNLKSIKDSIFKTNLVNNPKLLGAVAISAISMLVVLLVEPIQKIFKVTSLNLSQWLIVLGLSASIIFIVEIVKFFTNKLEKLKGKAYD